jgi:hypothetical protein
MENMFGPGIEVFARIRVELMAFGEEERQAIAIFDRIASELDAYYNQECEFDR